MTIFSFKKGNGCLVKITNPTKQAEAFVKATADSPAIKNFRERKLLKQILELRDQDGLITYTYTFSEMTGKLTFFAESIGYGIPAATQFTNPEKLQIIRKLEVTLPCPKPTLMGYFLRLPPRERGLW